MATLAGWIEVSAKSVKKARILQREVGYDHLKDAEIASNMDKT